MVLNVLIKMKTRICATPAVKGLPVVEKFCTSLIKFWKHYFMAMRRLPVKYRLDYGYFNVCLLHNNITNCITVLYY